MLKVCIVSGVLEKNGTGYIARNLGECLKNKGISKTHFIVKSTRVKCDHGFHFVNSEKWASSGVLKKIWKRLVHYLRFSLFLIANKATIVYISSSAFAAEAIVAKLMLRKVVLHINEGSKYITKRRLRVSCASFISNKTIAGSKYSLEVLPNWAKKKAVVIYNGVNVVPKKNINSEIKVIGVLGSLDRNKNQIFTIRQIDDYNKKYNRNIELIVCGPEADRKYLHEIEDAIKKSDSKVVRQTISTDINQFFEAIDLLVIPSLDECFPTVMLEAAANSVPVLANDVGGIPEFIKHGISGFLFDLDIQGNFIRSLGYVVGSNSLQAIVDNAYDDVKNNFNINHSFDFLAEEILHSRS